MTEEQKAERKTLIANNRAMESATKVRREFAETANSFCDWRAVVRTSVYPENIPSRRLIGQYGSTEWSSNSTTLLFLRPSPGTSTSKDEAMQTKITVIIDNPAEPELFEREMPAIRDHAGALPGLLRLESAKVWPKEDGTDTPAYRTLDLYFEDYGSASNAVGTATAGAFFEALSKAGGSFTGLFSEVESR